MQLPSARLFKKHAASETAQSYVIAVTSLPEQYFEATVHMSSSVYKKSEAPMIVYGCRPSSIY